MNTANMNQNNSSIFVTEANLPTGIIYKNKATINNINFWHKFIITNSANVPRNVILRAILDHVHPLDLIPVSFSTDKSNTYFLARNCGAAIEKLCKDNLTVSSPNTTDAKSFKLNIILRFATTAEFKIDVQKNISGVLIKRYNVLKKTLDLSKFHEDPDLSEFCPLSQPKIMFFILHLSKNLLPPPEKYILCDNLIKLLNPMEALVGMKITYLDIRNNLVMNKEDLNSIKPFHLTELLLDNNPLCAKFDKISYLQVVRSLFPQIEKLDGIQLKDGCFPSPKANFLCDPQGYDLVNQFLEHFFTIYDSSNRQLMDNFYHRNAMFSLTSAYITGQISSGSAQLRHYNVCARNLLKLADFSRHSEYLFQGNLSIMKLFAQLPSTEHDSYSFKTDLIYYTAYCAVICVSGVFRELPDSLLVNERLLGFSRTFTLEILNGDGECCIVNEQLHVYNALNKQVTDSFKTFRPGNLNIIPQTPNQKEQQQLADTLKIITNLNTDWAKKCLEECNYDLKKALLLFVDLYKVDKIPPEGFLKCK